jgi:membrane protein DedA with SNARE-associated domain
MKATRFRSVERQRRITIVVAICIGAVTVVNLCVTAASSWLLAHHPLLLVWLDARPRYLVLAAPLVENTSLLVLAASLRRLAADPAYFALGRMFDDEAAVWKTNKVLRLNPAGRAFRWIERAFKRASWPLVFIAPGLPVCFLAGASGMSFRAFAFLNFTGTVTLVATTLYLAERAESPLLEIGAWNARNQVVLTILLVAIALAGLVSARRRARSTDPPSTGQDPEVT